MVIRLSGGVITYKSSQFTFTIHDTIFIFIAENVGDRVRRPRLQISPLLISKPEGSPNKLNMLTGNSWMVGARHLRANI